MADIPVLLLMRTGYPIRTDKHDILSIIGVPITSIMRIPGGIRTLTDRSLNPMPLPIGLRIHTLGEIRTRTVLILSQSPPASWATSAYVKLPDRLERSYTAYKAVVLPLDDGSI